jgi:hypothetical protein
MKDFRVYKPVKDFPSHKGAAFQFSPGRNKRGDIAVYLCASAQSKPKPAAGSTDSPFEWGADKTIRMRLDLMDLGKILCVLTGIRDKVDIVHKFSVDGKEHTKSFKLEKGNPGTYRVNASVNKGVGWENAGTFFGADDAIIFELFIQTIVQEYFRNELAQKNNPTQEQEGQSEAAKGRRDTAD